MTCSFCGREFDAAAARSGCGACPWTGGCHGVRCPHCGYDMPEMPKTLERLGAWIRGLVSRKEASAPAPAARVDNDELPLTALAPGQSGTVVRLATGGGAEIQKLLAFGVLPGTSLLLRRRYPAFVLKIGFTQLAVDEAMAAAVMVRPDHEPARA